MTHNSAVTPCQAERILQLGATGENAALEFEHRTNRRRRETTRTTQHHLTLVKAANDGIISANVYRSIVNEKIVGDAVQAFIRLVIAKTDRLIGDVPARHNKRST